MIEERARGMIVYKGVVLDNSYLEHHGVKGQKWGVRKAYEYVKRGAKRTTQAIKNLYDRKTGRDIKKMSDDEIRAKIERLNLEDQLRVSQGQMSKKAESALKVKQANILADSMATTIKGLIDNKIKKNEMLAKREEAKLAKEKRKSARAQKQIAKQEKYKAAQEQNQAIKAKNVQRMKEEERKKEEEKTRQVELYIRSQNYERLLKGSENLTPRQRKSLAKYMDRRIADVSKNREREQKIDIKKTKQLRK